MKFVNFNARRTQKVLTLMALRPYPYHKGTQRANVQPSPARLIIKLRLQEHKLHNITHTRTLNLSSHFLSLKLLASQDVFQQALPIPQTAMAQQWHNSRRRRLPRWCPGKLPEVLRRVFPCRGQHLLLPPDRLWMDALQRGSERSS